MEELFHKAVANVERFEEEEDRKEKELEEKATEHFFEIFKNLSAEEKIEKASLSGKSQILLYRFNLNRNTNHRSYMYEDLSSIDLLSDESTQLYKLLSRYYAPFRLHFQKTSSMNYCLFLYWREDWDDESV